MKQEKQKLRAVFCITAICASFLLSAYTRPAPEQPLPQKAAPKTPKIIIDPNTGEKSMLISVLTYNVEGLPLPIKWGRAKALERIGNSLADMRKSGIEPDIVLIQEGFIDEMKDLINRSGYPNFVHGPTVKEQSYKKLEENGVAKNYDRKKYWFIGEGWGKLLHSGLYILSDFPVTSKKTRPFRYCAGWDCLANKGVLAVTVYVPGLPEPIVITNTHLNARAASDVPYRRSLIAHNLQIDELKEFAKTIWNGDKAIIFGGDFNVRNKENRIAHALKTLNVDEPYMVSRHYCTQIVNTCDIRMKLKGEEPWRHTQDLQGFAHGRRISVEPVRIQAMFDGGVFGDKISDHDAYLVQYKLSWR